MNVGHDHDDEGNCIESQGQPIWRFSLWDMAGALTYGIAGVLKVTGSALDIVAREFSAAANYQRQNYDIRQAQARFEYERELAEEALRQITGWQASE